MAGKRARSHDRAHSRPPPRKNKKQEALSSPTSTSSSTPLPPSPRLAPSADHHYTRMSKPRVSLNPNETSVAILNPALLPAAGESLSERETHSSSTPSTISEQDVALFSSGAHPSTEATLSPAEHATETDEDATPAPYTPFVYDEFPFLNTKGASAVAEPILGAMTDADGITHMEWDDDTTLEAYGIETNSHEPLPPALEKYINDTIKRPHSGPPTPTSTFVARAANGLQDLLEQDIIDLLRPCLLFKGEADVLPSKLGIKYIKSLANLNLNLKYLPSVPELRKEKPKSLIRPQPNTIIGYVKAEHARKMRVDAPFTAQQEEALAEFAISQSPQVLPFLSCQWKSSKSGQTHWHAVRQGARDGAAIVNNKCQMFEYARIAHTEADTCHFSATVDSSYIALYVHWCGMKDGKKRFYMRRLGKAFFANDDDSEVANPELEQMRGWLHNLLEHAVGDGLERAEALIAGIQARKPPPAPARAPSPTADPTPVRRKSKRDNRKEGPYRQ